MARLSTAFISSTPFPLYIPTTTATISRGDCLVHYLWAAVLFVQWLCTSKKESSLLILGSVTRLLFCNGQMATGPVFPYHTAHSCPSLPDWSHITYLGSRNEFVCRHFWKWVNLLYSGGNYFNTVQTRFGCNRLQNNMTYMLRLQQWDIVKLWLSNPCRISIYICIQTMLILQ